MQATYEKAITKVFEDEGGYTNDAADPGGPTNWGITIKDARMYWKPTATAMDVETMPKDVAESIYLRHYATPIRYDDLPAGVDYSVLDFAINSGIFRAVETLQRIVGVTQDGIIGHVTLDAINSNDPVELINALWDERLKFLEGLHTWPVFGKGWTRRILTGRVLALSLTKG